MGKTKQELVSDIELKITRGKPSDDLELEKSQIEHWLDVTVNSVVSDYLNKLIRANKPLPPRYIAKVLSLQLNKEVSNNTDEGIRHYLDMSPYDIMSLDNDRGIVRVSTLSGKRVNAVIDEENFEMLNKMYFSKPSRENLLWYREGDHIFVKGYGNSITTAVKLNVFYVPVIEVASLSDSAEINIGDDLLPIVIQIVEEQAFRQLGMGFEDLQNDGTQA
jgi:hypothetical protein